MNWMVLKVERGAELEIAKLLPSACLLNDVAATVWLPRLDKMNKRGVRREILLLRGFVFVKLSDWRFAIRLKGLLNRITGFLHEVGRTAFPQLLTEEVIDRFRAAIEGRDDIDQEVKPDTTTQVASPPEVGSRVWLLDRSIEAVVTKSGSVSSTVALELFGRMIEASVENSRMTGRPEVFGDSSVNDD